MRKRGNGVCKSSFISSTKQQFAHSSEAVAAAASLDAKHRHEADSQVKSYRAQAEFGAKKFIKP